MNTQHQTYCSSPEWTEHLQQEVLPRAAGNADLGDSMVEFGPGAGAATEWLAKRVRVLTLVESDAEAATRLRERFKGDGVSVVTGDCTSSGLAGGAYDSVACFTVLHHLPTGASQRAALREAFRLLKPGGLLVGSDSLGSDDLHRFHEGDVYNPVDPAWLLLQLQETGFEKITLALDRGLAFAARKPQAATDESYHDAIEEAAATMPLQPALDHEDPREGDPGGAPCRLCSGDDSADIWNNAHWRLLPRPWSHIPGSVLLIARAHHDTLSALPAERQREFGVIAAAVEHAIMRLGGSARVHLYRWGDGRAHFHVHFVPRPYGRMQFAFYNLPYLETRLPRPGDDELQAALQSVGTELTRSLSL